MIKQLTLEITLNEHHNRENNSQTVKYTIVEVRVRELEEENINFLPCKE